MYSWSTPKNHDAIGAREIGRDSGEHRRDLDGVKENDIYPYHRSHGEEILRGVVDDRG